MKTQRFILTLTVILALLLANKGASTATQVQPSLSQMNAADNSLEQTQAQVNFHNNPVVFIENVGQFDKRARFQVRNGNNILWLAEDALWLTVLEPAAAIEQTDDRTVTLSTPASEVQGGKGASLRLSFIDANLHPRIEPFNRLEVSVNYFLNNNPDEWQSNVPIWEGVRYVDLYPGVDLELTGQGGSWIWRLVVREPQFSISSIRLRLEGIDELTLASDCLHVTTAAGEFNLPLFIVEGVSPNTEPAISELQSGVFEVASPFSLASFSPPLDLSSTQDRPTDLLYSTFLGGSGEEPRYSRAIALDAEGNVYVVGTTQSADFPTTAGAFDTSLGGNSDAFIAKVSPDGTGLAYATYLGGSNGDSGYAIAVDEAGNAYVTGCTQSADFPTTSAAFDRSYGGSFSDAFVTKLNSSGNVLLYSTFLGGSAFFTETGYDIAVDSTGAAYVTGETWSSDFPITSVAFDTTYNGEGAGYGDAFAVKLNSAGTALDYATFLGGTSGDSGRGITVRNGSAYVTGFSSSWDFPTTAGAFDLLFNGGCDAFVMKLSTTGSTLTYATFLGGSDNEVGYDITVDGAGNAYATGYTRSPDFPVTVGAFDTSYNGGTWGDAFVVQLNSNGADLTYATYLGGSDSDTGYGITTNEAGEAYVTGNTKSSDFPATFGAFDTNHNGGEDAFVVRVRVGGIGLTYATFLGGSNDDVGSGIAVDGIGDAYVAGSTNSSNFPTTTGAFDTSHNGSYDAFAAKLAVRIILTATIDPATECTLVYTDTQGNPTIIQVPSGAVTESTTLLFAPVKKTTAPSGSAFAGHAFDLEAYRGESLLQGFTFNVPVTITIHYSDTDVGLVTEEISLTLKYRGISDIWEDVNTTCMPPSMYTRDTTSNIISVPVCHLSEFALFGPTHQVYIPLALRDH